MQIRRIPVLSLLAVAAALLAMPPGARAQPAASDAADLRPHFVAGRTARYEVWTRRDQAMSMSVAGQQRDANTSFEIIGQMTWSVQSVRADGSATCVMTFDYLAATIVLPDGTTQACDSRKSKGDNEGVQRLLASMAGVPIRTEAAADGSIQGVSGADQIRQRAGAEIKAPEDLDYVETASDLATIPLAPPMVPPGGGWDAPYRWTHEMGHVSLPTRYRLASVQDIAGIPIATVDATAKPRLEVDLSQLPADAPKIDNRQTGGQYQGQILMDLDRHEVAGRNSIQTLNVETKVHLPNNQTLVRVLQETIQSQALRIAEQ